MEQRLGNYHLTRLLGSGGFADVYYGEHLYLKTAAAIKVLRVQIMHEDHEKFLAEARIAARLEHPHIISVLEFGIEHTISYLVMDYATNGTLRQQYPKGTQLTTTQIMPVIEHVTSALHYTHQQHLIHRDVKPENMLLNSKHDILLSDFGIALVVQNTQHSDAQRHVVGTIAYMAPEQLRGEPCPASDQYSLGAVIYEWLCGEPPFCGSYTEVAIQHALVPPTPLCKRVPHLSSEIEEVVMIALAKDPQARFKSIKAFANAFMQACILGQQTEIAETLDNALVQSDVIENAKEVKVQKRLSRRIFAIGLGLLGGVSLVGGGAFAWKFLLQRSQTPAETIPALGTTLYTYHGSGKALAWSNDSQRIASADSNVQVWEAQTGRVDSVYRLNRDYPLRRVLSIAAVVWSPDNKYIAGGVIPLYGGAGNVTVYVWDVSTGQVAYIYHHTQHYQTPTLAWSPDGTSIASTDGQSIQVWKALTGSQISSYTEHKNPINSLSWSSDGKWVASSEGENTAHFSVSSGEVHIWEAATGRVRMIYHGHPDPVHVVAWSPNGQLIASAGGLDNPSQVNNPNNNTVQIWKPMIDEPALIYHGHLSPVRAIAWSPTSKFVVSGSQNRYDSIEDKSASVQAWDATTGQTLLSYMEHNVRGGSYVSAVAWSPDGKRIASAGRDVQVWRAI